MAYNQFEPEQLEEIKNYFYQADYRYIVLSVLIAAVSYYSRAHRWLFSLEHMGHKVPFINSFVAVNTGYLLNLTIPRSGEVTRAGILTKTDNIPFQKGFGSIIAERIIDFLILLFITAIVIIFKIDDFISLSNFETSSITNAVIVGFVGLIFVAVTLFFLRKKGGKLISFFKSKTSGIAEGIQSMYKLQRKKEFIFHTLLIWISYVLMFYVTIFAFSETSTLTFDQTLTAFVTGSFAVVFTNGGFGAYPFLIAKVFLMYQIPETIGTAFGWIVWASQIILILILGGFSLLMLPYLKKQ
ncbi:MAG: flippase-like domain-containing protein [Flavobacteriales bacterium]|nr:flippase-like domain-containing protein [Flavobacteriales bacterium]